MEISAATSSAASTVGGKVSISGGTGANPSGGSGGDINLMGGRSAATLAGGSPAPGGKVAISGGDALDGSGGSISLIPGFSDASTEGRSGLKAEKVCLPQVEIRE